MSKKGKIALFSALGLVLVTMIIFNLHKARGDSFEVQTEKVKRGDITQTVSGTGRIHPEKDVNISAFVSAEIIRLHIREGDHVKTGQLLAELDRTRYEAALEQTQSNLKSTRASLKKSRSDLTRARELYHQRLSSQADLEAAEANFELAESQVQQAEAALRQSADDLSKSRLIAPMDGTVAQLRKEEGEIALGSQFQADVIMTVADLTRMETRAEIDENDVVLVSLGDSAAINVDALPEKKLKGVVSEIAHTATTRGLGTQEEVTNFEVKIRILTPPIELRPGMSATVDIATETHEDVLYVPIQAVTVRDAKDLEQSNKNASNGKSRSDSISDVDVEMDTGEVIKQKIIFVVHEGTVEAQKIEDGLTSDKYIEILSGAAQDEEIVTGPYRVLSKQLKPGSSVKINNKAKKFRAEK